MRDGRKTKALIEKKALKLSVKKGIRETTIKDIAKAARIAEGMVLGIVLQIIDTRILSGQIKQNIPGMADFLAAACLRVLNA